MTPRKRLPPLLLILSTAPAWAYDANVTWINATQYEDGSLIVDGTGDDVVASTRVVYGTCSAPGVFGTETGAKVVPWPGAAASFTGLPGGTYCFRARHTTVGGTSSNWSGAVAKTYSRKPKQPTAVVVP
jgi:hypothetical protein